jgi:hypothetical protein
MVLNGLLHLVWLLLCHRHALLRLIASGIAAAILAAPVDDAVGRGLDAPIKSQQQYHGWDDGVGRSHWI